MSPAKHFFEAKKDSRDLPGGKSRRSPAVAAAVSLLYGEGDVQEAADRLMEELCSPHTALLDRITTRPLSSLFHLLSEFSVRYPTVIVEEPPAAMPPVSVSVHTLYFAAATAVHHTAKEGTPITLTSCTHPEEETVSILITAARETEDEEAALSVLGLADGRLALLTALGKRGNFTPSVRAGARTELCLTIPVAHLGTVRVQALDDPSLLAAFMLPLTYFGL